jgi:hypothetical protein
MMRVHEITTKVIQRIDLVSFRIFASQHSTSYALKQEIRNLTQINGFLVSSGEIS